MAPRSSSSGYRYFDVELAKWTNILLPSFTSDARLMHKIKEDKTEWFTWLRPCGQLNICSQHWPGCWSIFQLSCRKDQICCCCWDTSCDWWLVTYQEGLQDKGISPRAQEFLLQSWRGSTKKQYTVNLRKWELFLRGRDINPILPYVSDVLDFLTELFKAGLRYSTASHFGSSWLDSGGWKTSVGTQDV